MNLKTDEDEHSIEMQLPYIAKVMERFYKPFFFEKLASYHRKFLFLQVKRGNSRLSRSWLAIHRPKEINSTAKYFPSIFCNRMFYSLYRPISVTGVWFFLSRKFGSFLLMNSSVEKFKANDFVTPIMIKSMERSGSRLKHSIEWFC
jgi:hypothetical protein